MRQGLATQPPGSVVEARPRDQHAAGVRLPDTTTRMEELDLMSIIAWIVLGAIAGYIAGLLVRGDEGMGIIGHIVLGIIGALVGGFLASALFGIDAINGALDISSIVTAIIGAVIVVVVWNALAGRTRTGRGMV
jgi:uncharacterized membrane protein YeaQ/YmgE (transglycosylase-associated protein family)